MNTIKKSALVIGLLPLLISSLAQAQNQGQDQPPPPPTPPLPAASGVVEQAGVGGTQAYGRAGVAELGGSLGFSKATDYTLLTVAPTVGWFFVDNFEASLILNYTYSKVGGTDRGIFTGLIEPSFHVPVTPTVYPFLGVGLGASYSKDPGVGFALAPRVGLNILIGRSGILTPAFNVMYSGTESIQTPAGTAIAVNTSYGVSAGYSVMW